MFGSLNISVKHFSFEHFMIRVVTMCFALAIALCVISKPSHASQDLDNNKEWVVVLKDPRPARLRGFQVKGYGGKHYSNSLELKRYGKRVAKQYDLSLKKAWFIDTLNVYCLVVNVNNNQSATLASLKLDKRVDWVQASNDFELLKTATSLGPIARVDEPKQYPASNPNKHLNGSGIRIALIDSGVSHDHPELSASVSLNQDLVMGGEPLIPKGEKHGTAMAGILVASPQNSFGLQGVAPAAQILAYRGCWETDKGHTQCNTLSLARALDNVSKAKPSILNLSLSGPRDRLLDSLVDKLVKQKIFIVAAFDPNRPQNNRFPVRRDGVLIVRAEHLNQQHENEFTAPGKRIVVSPDANYQTMSGHSVATAYTSGVLALIAQEQSKQAAFDLTDLVDSNGQATVPNTHQLLKLKKNL